MKNIVDFKYRLIDNGWGGESISVSEEQIRKIIRTRYGDGISFDNSTLLLLNNMAGEEIPLEIIDEIKKSMFRKSSEGLYYFNEDILGVNYDFFKDEINSLIENYGCFEVGSIYNHFRTILNEDIIQSESDLEEYIQFISEKKYNFSKWFNIRFGKKSRMGMERAFGICIISIEDLVIENNGIMAEEDCQRTVYGLSIKALRKIIQEYSYKLCLKEINEINCIQAIDISDLPDNLIEIVNNAIGLLSDINVAATLDAINVCMSLEIKNNFRETYGINDDKEFKKIVKRNYTNEPSREWIHGIFKEDDEWCMVISGTQKLMDFS